MEYIYAAMLLHKSGKKIDESAVKKVLEAAGVKVDDSRVRAVVAALESVDIEKAIKESASFAAPVSSHDAKVEHKEEKKEAKKEEEKKSADEAAAGLGALFG